MKLYHVSTQHNDEMKVDLSISPKTYRRTLEWWIPRAGSYDLFSKACESKELPLINGWKHFKVVAELIFEYIRVSEYPDSPSRLECPFFFKSLEDAITFIKEQRAGKGFIFTCEANATKAHYYNMDLFTEASDAIEINGLNEDLYTRAQSNACEYWKTSKEGTTEILYEGFPVIEKLEMIPEVRIDN